MPAVFAMAIPLSVAAVREIIHGKTSANNAVFYNGSSVVFGQVNAMQ
jgi:hypothetical protein